MQQTLYWTELGTLACGGCGAQATGDGKTCPYVIEHERDCETVPERRRRICLLPA